MVLNWSLMTQHWGAGSSLKILVFLKSCDFKCVHFNLINSNLHSLSRDRRQSGPVEIHRAKVTNYTVTNTETMFTFTARHRQIISPEDPWHVSYRSCDERGPSLFILNVDLFHLHICSHNFFCQRKCRSQEVNSKCPFMAIFPQSVRTTAVCIKHLRY